MAINHRRRPRRARVSPRGDRGAVTVQVVVLMPAMFLLMFTGMQAALIYHGRTVALAAAQEGARVAAVMSSTAQAGEVAASQFVDSAGGQDVLRDATVTATRDATTAQVTVSGTTLTVVPGWVPTITQSAVAPLEQVTG
ncbi:MAG: TadE/TadG family type IV pilus assembly protein [Cellulomonas sp.]